MADKKTTRPGGVHPNWANDDLIVDPGEPWNGATTKLEPGAGKRDDGWLPDEKPSAREFNQLKHELGLWVQYLSDIQPQNWDTPIEIRSGGVPTAEITCLGYDRASRLWWAGSNATEFLYSETGYSWIVNSPGVGSQAFKFFAAKRPSDAPTHVMGNPFFITGGNSGIANEIYHHKGGAWVMQTLAGGAGTQLFSGGVYDPSNQLWLMSATDNTAGAIPIMWWAPPGTMVWTKVALPVVTSTSASRIATNRSGLSVITGSGATPDVWTSSDGKIWAASATFTGTVRGLSYDEDLGVFVALVDTKTYTSTDGATWSLISDVTPGANFQNLLCKGGLWLAGLVNSREIRFSTNGGVTWHQIFMQAGLSTDTYQGFAYSPAMGQFMAWQRNVAGNTGWVNKSLAVGTGNISAAGVAGAEFTPQT